MSDLFFGDPFDLFICRGCRFLIDEGEWEEFNGFCCECYEINREVQAEEDRAEYGEWKND